MTWSLSFIYLSFFSKMGRSQESIWVTTIIWMLHFARWSRYARAKLHSICVTAWQRICLSSDGRFSVTVSKISQITTSSENSCKKSRIKQLQRECLISCSKNSWACLSIHQMKRNIFEVQNGRIFLDNIVKTKKAIKNKWMSDQRNVIDLIVICNIQS